MIKTQTIKQALDFVLGTPDAQTYINDLEAAPDKFVIASLSCRVIDYHQSIMQVIINFAERGDPNTFLEDAVVDVQGTNFTNFKVLRVRRAQIG